MHDRDSVINNLNIAKLILCNPQMLTPEMCIRIGQAITSAFALIKEQEAKQVNNVAQQISCFSGVCPNCGKMLNTTCNKNFCGECGQAVKWE